MSLFLFMLLLVALLLLSLWLFVLLKDEFELPIKDLVWVDVSEQFKPVWFIDIEWVDGDVNKPFECPFVAWLLFTLFSSVSFRLLWLLVLCRRSIIEPFKPELLGDVCAVVGLVDVTVVDMFNACWLLCCRWAKLFYLEVTSLD